MFQEVETLRFQDSQHMKVVRLSALLTGRLYQVLISVKRLSRTQGHSAPRRIVLMKNSIGTIWDRPRELPT